MMRETKIQGGGSLGLEVLFTELREGVLDGQGCASPYPLRTRSCSPSLISEARRKVKTQAEVLSFLGSLLLACV